MRSLIWKECRENLRWVPLPGLAILLVFLLDKSEEPMPDVTDAYFYCLIAVVFGAALGFVQVFFEASGDKRSILLHRPLRPSAIFLAKATAGVGLYLIALGIPFVALEIWYATPGKMPAPYNWRTSLPWLADILSGLVYYFAAMLVAQREARWYGSRCLPLAAAFFCSYIVWAVPEFWQALLAIGLFGSFLGVAAWGSFCTGGAYAPLPRIAKGALATSLLLGLLVLSMMGKQRIGEWFDPSMHFQVDVDRHGRVLYNVSQDGGADDISITDIDGQEAVELKSQRFWRADSTFFDWPAYWSYRNNCRHYVQLRNESKPGNERWYFDHAQGRLLGYDGYYHHFLGSFGPDGFTPAGETPGKRFEGKMRCLSNRWQYMTDDYLVFPNGVYTIDFGRRNITKLFDPADGDKVVSLRRWNQDGKRFVIVVGTDKAFHVVTGKGEPVVTLPRVLDHEKYGPVFVGQLENPHRYFVWYHLRGWLREPEEYRTEPSHLLEYDADGKELARRAVPPFPYPASSYANALFGLVTPMTEAGTLVGASMLTRAADRADGSIHKSSLLDNLENIAYYIPGTSTMATTFSPATQPGVGLIPGYVVLILLSAAACAFVCFQRAHRHAFSSALCIGWAMIGFLFGWVGLVLMLVLQEWPAHIACPKCGEPRVVTRDSCEHCGARHAVPVPDGTEIFEAAADPLVAVAAT
jgi:hypothetical protein